MKSTELRIGNIVSVDAQESHPRSYFVIRELLKDRLVGGYLYPDFSSEGRQTWYDSLYPILLDEDWFEQFGFHEIHDCMYYKYFDDLKIQLCNGPDWTVELSDSITEESEIVGLAVRLSGVCQYVHQLQNLYFSLTGEELELK